jgi:transcriptional regulator with XRE-family HTH domain
MEKAAQETQEEGKPPATDPGARLAAGLAEKERIGYWAQFVDPSRTDKVEIPESPEKILKELVMLMENLNTELETTQILIRGSIKVYMTHYRDTHHSSLRDLQKKTGVSASFFSYLLGGKYNKSISREIHVKLATSIGVPLSDLAPQRSDDPDHDQELFLQNAIQEARWVFSRYLALAEDAYGWSQKSASMDSGLSEEAYSEISLARGDVPVRYLKQVAEKLAVAANNQIPRRVVRSSTEDMLAQKQYLAGLAIGQEILRARVQKGLSQEELKTRLNQPKLALTGIEAGYVVDRSPKTLRRLDQILGTAFIREESIYRQTLKE